MTALVTGRKFCARNRNWELCSTSRVYSGLESESCADGRCILNVNFRPLYNVARDPVAPHGLMGQSLDGKHSGMDGKKDDYSAEEVRVALAPSETVQKLPPLAATTAIAPSTTDRLTLTALPSHRNFYRLPTSHWPRFA